MAVSARKRFGQHFLEPVWIAKVLDEIRPAATDIFLEIGPGRGALTLPLAEACMRVVAVEIDRGLAGELRRHAPRNVEVLEGDFLAADVVPLLAPGPIRVAGNLPYNVSSPILARLVALSRGPISLVDATLMLQLEVADRVVARAGSRQYGPLAILTQLHADVRRCLTLPPGAFRPAPKVRSALVRLVFRPPRVSVTDPGLLEELVRSIFSQRRKTILNALKPFAAARAWSARDALARAGLDAGVRPETLDLPELADLAEVFVSEPARAVL